MARSEIRFYSDTLGKNTTASIIFPNKTPGPWNVVYLLHGLSGDHASWPLDFPLEWAIGERPVMFVCPDGDRSYYVNETAAGGNNYEDFVATELPAFIDRTFPTQASREGRMVAGLSMGGYGAMMLGLKHPDVFGAIYSTSGAMYFAQYDHPKDEPYPTALMQSLDRDAYGCMNLAKTFAERDDGLKLSIKFDCGLQDYLLEVNRKLQLKLEKLGIPHEYGEYPGEHNSDYWRARMPEMMTFIDETFSLAEATKET